MSYQAVIFDFDGTLFDSLEDIARSANVALSQHGYPTHEIEAYRYFVGDGVRTLLSRILPEDKRDAENIASMLEVFKDHYIANWNVHSRPYPGIAEMLDQLAAKEIPFSVLSNKPDAMTKHSVQELFSAWNFALVLGESDEIPKKPDPAGALHIASKLGLLAQDILYVGDTSTDMKTAVAAGMYPVGVLWGFRSREELETSGAKILIRQPQELISLISK